MRFLDSSLSYCSPAARAIQQPVLALLLHVLLYLTVHHVVSVSAQAVRICWVPTNRLTFRCDNRCGSVYKPCWYNVSLVTTSAACEFQCYNMYNSDETVANFVFLVPFGAWKSAQQIASGDLSTDAVKGVPDDTANYISKSNDYLDTIDALVLPPTVNTVYGH